MCGIIGLVGNDEHTLGGVLTKALPALSLRGPDRMSQVAFRGAHLGHARLSVIDLATGDQPMRDNARPLTITYNGEIFNYKHLRRDLEKKGHTFSTSSDTEVILKAYIEYGERCPEFLDGQFAFAIWDDERKRLFMARDRFGEKPLFYSEQNGVFFFASEIKALLATGLVQRELDHTSIDNYLAMYFIPPWRSIYKGVTPLLPAHYAIYEKGKLTTKKYWELRHNPVTVSCDEATTTVRDMLSESVKSRMIADVPVGVFLSGGIDSSIITALAKTHNPEPLKSFSAGFDTYRNELPFAREVAEHVGTEHYERNIAVSLDDIRAVTRYYDEPLGDSSNVPTSLIAGVAREKVTVALSGDGGDELFFGYGHYRAHWNLPFYKKILAQILGYTPDRLFKRSHLNMYSVGERKSLLKDTGAIEYDVTTHIDMSQATTPLQRLNLLDYYLKLPGDMLVKVDRSSMMRSLEVRSPFLHHELAQFAFNLPDHYKTSHTHGKIILQKAFSDMLPENVFTRKKQGFGAPVKEWLRDPRIRPVVEDMWKDPRIGEFLHVDTVRRYSGAFYEGNGALGYKLWMLFALELWMREHS